MPHVARDARCLGIFEHHCSIAMSFSLAEPDRASVSSSGRDYGAIALMGTSMLGGSIGLDRHAPASQGRIFIRPASPTSDAGSITATQFRSAGYAGDRDYIRRTMPTNALMSMPMHEKAFIRPISR